MTVLVVTDLLETPKMKSVPQLKISVTYRAIMTRPLGPTESLLWRDATVAEFSQVVARSYLCKLVVGNSKQ